MYAGFRLLDTHNELSPAELKEQGELAHSLVEILNEMEKIEKCFKEAKAVIQEEFKNNHNIEVFYF